MYTPFHNHTQPMMGQEISLPDRTIDQPMTEWEISVPYKTILGKLKQIKDGEKF